MAKIIINLPDDICKEFEEKVCKVKASVEEVIYILITGFISSPCLECEHFELESCLDDCEEEIDNKFDPKTFN